MRNKRGYILVAVVAFLAMAAALASIALMNARASVSYMAMQIDRAQMDASLQGAMARALYLLDDPDSAGAWGQVMRLHMPGTDVELAVQDVRGLVDINTASEELLAALIQPVIPDDTIQPPDPENLAAAIVDWRDADDESLPLGAEKRTYSAAGLPPPGNRPFADTVELGRVLGFTPDIVRNLLPLITVHSNLDKPRADLAPERILELLDLPPDALRAIHDAREADERPQLDDYFPQDNKTTSSDPAKNHKDQPMQWAQVDVRLSLPGGTRHAEHLLMHVSALGQNPELYGRQVVDYSSLTGRFIGSGKDGSN